MSKYDFTATRDDYLTPADIIEYVLGVNRLEKFDCDVCCSLDNIPASFRYRKTGLYLNSGSKVSLSNGLTGTWFDNNWCNPPFKLCEKFVKKAAEEQKKGHTTYMLIPARTETVYWAKYIFDGGRATRPDVDVEFLKKGVCCVHPETGEEMPVFKNALALVTFRGKRSVTTEKDEVLNA